MAQPPAYNQAVKEREEFERDVNTAGVGYSHNSRPTHTTSFSQSSYPADKSSRPAVPHTTSYGQPSSSGMGYGATQNPYISQQPQPMGQPMHYYRTPGGQTIASPFPPDAGLCPASRDGRHVDKRYYGVLGVVIGILFCPIGCIWTALDHQTRSFQACVRL
ncbi:hypothetical protein NliqN6_1586 [Naganishia liquefaciens]|uniref:Uncharacterized protein n=1 Tax=Naganishia liquefaciens TaxID=104408 RepID=A0A8H3TQN0_9TREE|nr:hypothetical protein NliqN6_1586 [Naganishia liquefaciens]